MFVAYTPDLRAEGIGEIGNLEVIVADETPEGQGVTS